MAEEGREANGVVNGVGKLEFSETTRDPTLLVDESAWIYNDRFRVDDLEADRDPGFDSGSTKLDGAQSFHPCPLYWFCVELDMS
jgi:hypothetical protein